VAAAGVAVAGAAAAGAAWLFPPERELASVCPIMEPAIEAPMVERKLDPPEAIGAAAGGCAAGAVAGG